MNKIFASLFWLLIAGFGILIFCGAFFDTPNEFSWQTVISTAWGMAQYIAGTYIAIDIQGSQS